MATILISNPGSASRKYALFEDEACQLRLHFEPENGHVIYTSEQNDERSMTHLPTMTHLKQVANQLPAILSEYNQQMPQVIALRVVAPSAYFLQHRRLDGEALEHLRALEIRSPLHIGATLQEFEDLQRQWPEVPVLGISDSAFHATKPDYAWNYGIKLEDADRYEIKRFGYHGLSASSIVRQLEPNVPGKLVICHLGSGVSVMAVHNRTSIETTMGFSPLEGLPMSTRSGNVDIIAVRALQDAFGINDDEMRNYLYTQSGLLGLSGYSSDVRALLRREDEGDYRAGLALTMYVYRIRQAIGQMAASMGGVDALAFSGVIGECAPAIRRRIVEALHFLDFELDHDKNSEITVRLTTSQPIHAFKHRPILVVPTKEEQEMAYAAMALLG